MNKKIKVIGIDCATDVKSTGLSVGTYNNYKIELKETRLGTKNSSIAEIIFSWITPEENVLLAIDAPLGWPANLGHALYNHNAGKIIDIDSNDLFRRETDKFIKKTLGKQPLDVGADRIARTAYSALKIIWELRLLTGEPIELAWDNVNLKGISAIEVYPAATLGCYGIKSSGYKEKNQQSDRGEIIAGLREHMIMPNDVYLLEQNADALDSSVCLLAAKDFIEGNVYYPEDLNLARKEGWIWVKKGSNNGII
jgi:predicted RNase H-like nuclease